MTTQPTDGRRGLPGRPWWWVAGAAVLVLAILALWGVLGDERGTTGATGDPTTGPSGSSTSAGSSSDGLEVPTATASPGQTEPGLAEVPSTTPKPVRARLGEAAEIERGVTARVVRHESVQGEPKGRGERAGPAVRFTIEITNDTSSRLDLRGATVTAYHGRNLAPAPDIGGPGVKLFPASAAPGTTARGVYVFTIPPKRRDLVTVHVSYRGELPTAVFRGSVA